MEIGTLDWYRELQKSYSVSTITGNDDPSTTAVYLIVAGIKYMIPLKELDRWMIRN